MSETAAKQASVQNHPEMERDLRILGLSAGGLSAGGAGAEGAGPGDAERAAGGAPKIYQASFWRARRKWAVAGAAVLALAAFLGIGRLARPYEIELVAVSPREVGLPPVTLTAAGYVMAKRQIIISSKAQGKITELLVQENDALQAGQVIARLEDEQQRANLALAQAEFTQAKSDLDRIGNLQSKGVSSGAELDQARTKFEVAKARRDLAQVQLEDAVVRAPIDGTVIRKIRDVGEFLTLGVSATGDPGTAVVTLADLSEMLVELEINETEITKIRSGQYAMVTPEALPERRYLAQVSEIAAMADRQKSIVKAKVRIERPDADLKPDMTAKVAFLETKPEGEVKVVPALPESAVVEREGRKVVFAVQEGRAVLQAVETRPVGEGSLGITQGPPEGTFVIKNPPPGLRDGGKVRVKGG